LLILTNINNLGQAPVRNFAAKAEAKLDENGEPRFLENVQMFL
jgi:hypothetical protein